VYFLTKIRDFVLKNNVYSQNTEQLILYSIETKMTFSNLRSNAMLHELPQNCTGYFLFRVSFHLRNSFRQNHKSLCFFSGHYRLQPK
jgi:hypothetical protein